MALSVYGEMTSASRMSVTARCNAGNWYAVFIAPSGTSYSSSNWLCIRSTTNSTGSAQTFSYSGLDNQDWDILIAERSTSFATVGNYYSMTWTVGNLDYSENTVPAYDPGIVYDGAISLYDSGDYNYNTSYPYQGYIYARAVLYEGAGTGWYIQVNSSSTNITYISMTGNYKITLDNLYNPNASNYHINLYDPDGNLQDYFVVSTRNTPYTTHYLYLLANGGSGAPPTVSETVIACYQTVSLQIPYSTPTRDGYEFLGWSSSSTATSATYDPGEYVNVTGQRTLYAVWRQTSYTYALGYNANGGSGAPGDQTWTGTSTSHSFTVSYTEPTRSGYRFLGWSTSSTASSPSYYGGSTITLNSSSPTRTLYAVWERITYQYTVTYRQYSGSSLTTTRQTSQSYSETISYTVESLFSGWGRTNYTFQYWVDAIGNVYVPGNSYNIGGNITLTGYWTKQTVSRFYWNGSDSADASLFSVGNAVSTALTATRWNRLKAKIQELAARLGWTYSYSDTSAGTQIGAAEFNSVRTAEGNLTGHGSLPSEQSKGDRITTGLYNGSGSLKSSLNTAIDSYNNS